MNKKQKWFFLILIILFSLMIGYLKDFIFINLNTHLFYVKRNLQDVRSHTFFSFLNNFSFQQVYYMKYILTSVFLGFYYFLSLGVLKLIKKSELIKYLNIIYLLVIIVSLLFFVGGFVINKAEEGYSVSRVLIGPLESPLPLIFLLLASKINNIQQVE